MRVVEPLAAVRVAEDPLGHRAMAAATIVLKGLFN